MHLERKLHQIVTDHCGCKYSNKASLLSCSYTTRGSCGGDLHPPRALSLLVLNCNDAALPEEGAIDVQQASSNFLYTVPLTGFMDQLRQSDCTGQKCRSGHPPYLHSGLHLPCPTMMLILTI